MGTNYYYNFFYFKREYTLKALKSLCKMKSESQNMGHSTDIIHYGGTIAMPFKLRSRYGLPDDVRESVDLRYPKVSFDFEMDTPLGNDIKYQTPALGNASIACIEFDVSYSYRMYNDEQRKEAAEWLEQNGGLAWIYDWDFGVTTILHWIDGSETYVNLKNCRRRTLDEIRMYNRNVEAIDRNKSTTC